MKAKLILAALTLCAFFYSARVFSQPYQHGVFWIMFSQNDILARNETQTTDETINRIFQRYDVYKFRQVFPYAKKEENRRIYEVKFTNSADEQFINSLYATVPDLIEDTYRHSEQISLLYEPNDWHWIADKMWHLKKIRADDAWDIERGSEEVIIAIIDTYFDLTHHDLKTKFLIDYDPIDSIKFVPEVAGANGFCEHGTTVAGFAGAQTTEEGQIQPDSALNCSIGFRTKLIGYKAFSNDLLETGLHASTKMGADIISLSVCTGCNPNNGRTITRSVISEIFDNGTLIFQAAGNGFCNSCYFNGTEYKNVNNCAQPADFVEFSPIYPYSPDIDERIIVVTGVNNNDSLTRKVWDSATNQYKYTTFSYFPEVDVAAPGYDMMGLQTMMSRQTVEGDTLILPRPSFAFWNGFGGTSFATPIVSGLASLIRSRNPLLPVEELIKILKSNVDSVADKNEYLHPVTHESRTGTGRINAYSALKNTPVPNNYEICDSSEVVWTDKMYIKDYILICAGSTLRVQSDVYFSNVARVKVERGGKLVIDGGRLTGSTNQMWPGIIAYSKPDAPQNPINQSVVTLVNGGTIENAIVGITTDDPIPHNGKACKGGAIIISNDGVFRNCNVAVELFPYAQNSISSFKRTLFEINTKIAPDSLNPDSFIKLRNISGIRFSGCNFKSIDSRNITGITGVNAGFVVEGACNGISVPCNDITPSVFKNLNYGIHVSGIASAMVVRVENAIFEWNNTGVYLSGLSNSTLIHNQFFSSVAESINERGTEVGIYLDGQITR
jgi:subtilisin family serine protease